MKKIEAIIAQFLQYGCLLATICLIGTVMLQIFARFMLAQAPAWTEEASRLFFIYAISFAAGLALKEEYYVHWDLLYKKLSPGGQKLMDLLIPSLVLLLFVLMAIFSLSFIQMGLAESSPGMGMSMAAAFGSMFVLSVGLSLYAGRSIQQAIQNKPS
ncbi:MAG: TRAP transporter small permease subunit [Bacteroidota bacterium]